MNKRPNTYAIETRTYSRGTARLTRDRKTGLYYVEADLGANGLHQSTDFDDFDKANKAFDKLADVLGDLSAIMYVHEYKAV